MGWLLVQHATPLYMRDPRNATLQRGMSVGEGGGNSVLRYVQKRVGTSEGFFIFHPESVFLFFSSSSSVVPAAAAVVSFNFSGISLVLPP